MTCLRPERGARLLPAGPACPPTREETTAGPHAGKNPPNANQFVRLRFVLILAASYLFLASRDFRGLSGTVSCLILANLASNFALLWVPRAWLGSTTFVGTVIVVDTVWLSTLMVHLGHLDTDFFLLYFFVLFLAGVSESLHVVVLGATGICAAYLSASLLVSGRGVATTASFLLRIPLLLSAAAFYGYLIDRVRREREIARHEAHTRTQFEERERITAEHARLLEAANEELRREVLARTRLEEQLHKITSAVEQSPTAVVIMDAEGSIEYANPSFTVLTGLPAEQVVGEDWTVLESPDAPKGHREELWDVLRSGREWHEEIEVNLISGGVLWVSTRIFPLKGPAGEIAGYICVQEDITDRKKGEQKMERAIEGLSEVSQRKSAFVSIVSHELRTPLTSIRNAVDILRDKGGSLGPEGSNRFLDMARRNVDRLTGIVDDLLDLNRIEAGKLELRFGRLDAGRLLQDVFATFEPQAAAKGVALVLQRPAQLPEAWADSQRIEQVLSNLVSNAVKFTPAGEGITLAARAQGDRVEVSVSDTGIGISRADRDRIFEPFYQAARLHTRGVRGSGLGLTISKSLVAAHGGSLEVESVPGRGSRFSFALPACSPRAVEMADLDQKLREYRSYPSFSLLLVEARADGPDEVHAPGNRQGELDLVRLREAVKESFARSCDDVISQEASRRLVVVLPLGTRADALAVRENLSDFVSSRSGEGAGAFLVQGPACFPEDGQSAWDLVERCGKQDRRRDHS